MAHVYLIEQVGDGLYKIGIAVDVDVRLSVLQAGNPSELFLVCHSECGDKARVVESALHERYKRKSVRREWYALTPSDVAEVEWIIVLASRLTDVEKPRFTNTRIKSANDMPRDYVSKYLDAHPEVLEAAGNGVGYREIATAIEADFGIETDHTTVFRVIRRIRALSTWPADIAAIKHDYPS